MCVVLLGLEIQHRRHLGLLAAFERHHGVAFRHRLFRLPVRIVGRQHAIGDVRIARGLALLRVAIAADRIDHGPQQHGAAYGGIRAARERERRIARIARAHRGEHGLVAAARRAHHTDQIWAAPERRRARLRPADPVVDVLHGAGIRRVGRHPEVERDDGDAGLREVLVNLLVGHPALAAPRAAVQGHHQRERPVAARLEGACDERLVAVLEVLDFLDVELKLAVGCHRGLLREWSFTAL